MEVVTMGAGAALASLLQSVFDSLKSSDLLNFARGSGVSKELGEWETMVKTIYAVLDNAEEQQWTNDSVKIWFNDLRNLAYDVEDILDEYNTEAGRLKLRVESKASSSKVRKLIRSYVARSGFGSRAKFNSHMVSEVKKISEGLENMKKKMDFLELSVGGKNSRVEEGRTSEPTTSLVNEAQIYGRGEDRKRILDRLKVEAGDGETPVIAIVGMGGVGKTTLAQLVYNDESLQFDFKAWVTVGEDFDVPIMTKTILRQLGGDGPEDLNSLQLKLKEKLSNNKALVVLDDVWIKEEDYHKKWTLFYGPFAAAETPGTRIIVTTRNQSVSRITSAADGYSLQGLSSDDCLSVLAYHALGRKDFNEHLHLKEVGEKIIEKCDGLPLAAKALGGVLRGQQNVSSWEEVYNSKIWEERNIVLPALKLSYYHLPSYLKRCFGYTAIFPKDYEFDKTRLVLLWMGEGFVQQINDGNKYFDDLFARSLFQKSSNDESLFVMHDLINDLARSVSGNICFNLDEEVKAEKPYAEVRHSALACHEYEIAPRFERFHEMKHLKTFLALKCRWEVCYLSPTVLDVMIQKFKCLRVLALPYAISELPTSIDCLKHLQHLDLSHAQIELLPESLSKLFNLQALILFQCQKLIKLPKDLCNLINLQCLDVRGTHRLEEMPLHIGNLKNLQTLGKFIVGNSEGCGIAEMLKIPNLQGQLHISQLQNVIKIQDVEHRKMSQKEGIIELTFEWTDKFDDSRNERNDLQVLSSLKPQKNITKVSIKSYGGNQFPPWIGDPSFDKMTFLELSNCCDVVSLPPLGQLPSLEKLILNSMNGVKELGLGFYGNVPSSSNVFRSLKILRIQNMEELDQWSHYSIDDGKGQVFPELKELLVEDCPKLVGCLPKHLPALELLKVCRCALLEFLPEKLPSLVRLVVVECKEGVLRSVPNLESLTTLEIRTISGLVSFNVAFFEALVSLQVMVVNECDELKHLFEDGINMDRLRCLKQLRIWWCRELVSLVEGKEGNFPPNLQDLYVSDCEKLEKLPNQLHSLTSLASLTVIGCPKLETFSTKGLPSSVKHVAIEGCGSLVSLPQGIIVDGNDNSYSHHMPQIEDLTIECCASHILPSNGGFPASLRHLFITGPLETQLFRSLQVQNGLLSLTFLDIYDCPLESFPDTGLPIPTLLFMRLMRCEKVRSLPNHMVNFTSLRSLYMIDCPEVASFPRGGLPPSLERLGIAHCDKLEGKLMSERSLNALTCLEGLSIAVGGGMNEVKSFPDDSLLLPTSLVSLQIQGFQNLTSISSGLQKLTSLQSLSIKECHQLQALPKGALPPSLGCLQVYDCPILEKRCRKREGDLWHLIATVPRISNNRYSKEFANYIKPERLKK